MTSEQLKQTWHATPFRPFVLHLADGRQIPVKHPDFLSISPSGRTIIVHQLDDSFNIIDLLLVTDIEVKDDRRRCRPRRKRVTAIATEQWRKI